MTPEAKTIAAFLVALIGPLLYVSRDHVSITLPNDLSPILPPVHRLQQYLRIRTDQPSPAYLEAAHFLNQTITTLLPSSRIHYYSFVPGKPVVLATLPGLRPDLPSVLLNSHSDVVPAEPAKWRWDPFAARSVVSDAQLRIYARGSQDMKSVGMQYVESLSELVRTGWRPLRDVHISFVPDEEIGGIDGMGKFVKSDIFKKLNVGVAMDEGLPNPEKQFNVYYSERQTWWLSVHVSGSPGHGFTLPTSTAANTLHKIIANALAFREKQAVDRAAGKDLGRIIGVNIAYLKAGTPDHNMKKGYVMNVIPSTAEAGFDIRVPPHLEWEEVEKEIEEWLRCPNGERCPGTTYSWVLQVKNRASTSRNPSDNPYITPFMQGMKYAGVADRLKHGVFPAATDARYLREAGVQCFGFSPIEKTADLLHKHNEFISVDGYMAGIRIYKNVIKELADFDPSLNVSGIADLERERSDQLGISNSQGEIKALEVANADGKEDL